MVTYCIFQSSLTSLSLLLPTYYLPYHQRLITPDKSEAERVNDIFTVVEQENGPSSWWMEVSRVIHECTQHVQISQSAFLWCRFTVCTCIIGASLAYGGEAAGQGRGVPLPTDGGFHPGLIRASAGGDRWPAERSRDCHPPPPSTPHQSPPDFASILACVVCMIVRHKGRNFWHNKSFYLFLFFFYNILLLPCTSYSTCPSLVLGCHMELTADPPLALCAALRTP